MVLKLKIASLVILVLKSSEILVLGPQVLNTLKKKIYISLAELYLRVKTKLKPSLFHWLGFIGILG